MVSTPTVAAQLRDQGLPETRLWGRGVDLDCFDPAAPPHPSFAGLDRPIQLFVGRVAIEKNIEAHLASRHEGTKVVVGDGPALDGLRRKYPDALFLGALRGAALASAYSSADVFVFPSRTDTFGLVVIEALASGVPVAAFPVQGPLDILGDAPAGVMDEDLGAACRRALAIPRELCRSFAQRFTWEAASRQFLTHLAIPDLEPFETLVASAGQEEAPRAKAAV
jgi:glycosyltransferase involved in cell wall biosynthesis